MKKYSIAAIIPAYNCQQTLERAVESLLTQTYPISEIIIVNNNSTDNTQQIINKLINEYPILVKSIIESKPGANLARNTGLKIAHGDWIQLLDADDELLPGKLNHQINLITAQPGADLICSAAIKIIDNDPAKNKFKTLYVNDDKISGLINSEAGITSSNLWKRETLLALGLFDPEITSSQEYYMMLEFFKNDCEVIKDHLIKTNIYVSEESISNTNNADRSIEIMINRINYYNKLMKVLKDKNKLNSNYKNEIISNINRPYCYNVIRYGHSHMSKLKEIKKQFEISPSWKDIIVTYAHQVYSMYTIKKGLLKYPDFAFNLFIRVGKLLLFR